MIKFTQSAFLLLHKAWFLLIYRCSQQRWHTGEKTMTMFSPTFHRDNTVTFWSVYEQRWVRCKASRISDAELASMSDSERRRVARIVAKEVL